MPLAKSLSLEFFSPSFQLLIFWAILQLDIILRCISCWKTSFLINFRLLESVSAGGEKGIKYLNYLEGNMVTIVVALEATSLGVVAVAAPSCFRSTTASENMSWTKISCPAFNKFFAMGPPMFPKPINPMGSPWEK